MELLAVALILLLNFSSTLSTTIDCAFKTSSLRQYTCIDINLNIEDNNVKVTEATGDHSQGFDNGAVTAIYFLSPQMKSLPQNVFEVFPNLSRFVVHGFDVEGEHLDKNALINGDFFGAKTLSKIMINGVNLNVIRSDVFQGAENLDFLSIEASGITKVEKNAFKHMPELRSLSLNYNLLKSLRDDTFAPLVSLKILMVAGNFIHQLQKPLFENLEKLSKVSFISNRLEIIDPSIVDSLPALKYFYLDKNLCVNLNFGSLKTKLSEFKKLVANCTQEKTSDNQIKTLQENNQNLLAQVKDLSGEEAKAEREKESLDVSFSPDMFKGAEGFNPEAFKAFQQLFAIKQEMELEKQAADRLDGNSALLSTPKISESLMKKLEIIDALQDE